MPTETFVDTALAGATWTIPEHVGSITFEAYGSGGAPALVISNGSNGQPGGCYATTTITAPFDASYAYYAPPPKSGYTAGREGAYVCEPYLVYAAGGKQGSGATGGAGAATADCVGATLYKGGNGANGTTTAGAAAGGGGGSSAGTAANGNNGSGVTGGSAPTGGGAGGNGGASGTNSQGSAGSQPGGGGGGGSKSSGGGGDATQVAGGVGQVKITWSDATSNTYTASNNTLVTVGAGITSATIECWGAGGPGAGSTSARSGGGGGGGAYAKTTDVAVTAGETLLVRVGDTSNVYPTTGDAGPSFVARPIVVAATGTTSTTTSYGTTKYGGGAGGTKYASSPYYGGGGGSSAGTASNGNNGANGTSGGVGAGGTAPTGGYAGGAGGAVNGSNYGGGGGGRSGGQGLGVGGDGGKGAIIITYTLAAFSPGLNLSQAVSRPATR